MGRNLFIGSLPYAVEDEELREVFEKIGAVKSAKVVKDRETQRSRGFGFVEMESDSDGERAIQQLDGSRLHNRQINVRVANPRPERGQDRGRASAS